ncbi:IS66 family insertion sequence element accessory protein TnpB [uncultured Bacteroides sp.]|uniref:IS66 family insertion sequence element accessory protein TnpB n=1 Tax=uncultured Bacteroides sp. TaxID=162156 RepID=UPI0026075D6A|nr:IS66 family insertion sequence element accessory protein TnpB [uncultured Bacteroides sp.]
MLTITGLKKFYYLPQFHDMRCKSQRVSEIIRSRYHRDPLNGDVYIFMSKDRKKVKMIHFENHAYYLHEKCFTNGYQFMKIELQDDIPVYKIDWKDLISVLESPVIKRIRI